MNRRKFLTLSAATAGVMVVGPYFRGRSYAAPFGESPSGAPALPQARRAKRVLEIFLYGGLSAWETLYLVEEFGRPTDPDYPNEQFYCFNDVVSRAGSCGFDTGGPVGQFFAQDAAGMDVKLGPFASRIWSRDDVLSRMRIVVQKHLLEPHEAAVPQALTGRPVGQPAAAGLGAHVQRYFVDRDDGSRKAPHSYVFAVGGLSGDNVSAGASAGVHPGVARPLLVKVTNAERLSELLQRPTVGTNRAAYDELMNIYTEQYQKRLQWPDGDVARSRRFADLDQARKTVANVDAIASVMDDSIFQGRSGTACGQSASFDIPGVSLNAARHLLTHPTEPASYVCVSDVGLYEASGGGGYDTHTDNSRDQATNFDNMLKNLLSIINGPGEADPTKLDLDDTLIILNTEFGRTGYAQDGDGRNHHPYGYVTSFIGGPITSAEAGIYGNIKNSAVAGTYCKPAENRVAALMALGIWPFSPEAFAVSDVLDAESEADAAEKAVAHYLGIAL